jgi:hypothetical protein
LFHRCSTRRVQACAERSGTHTLNQSSCDLLPAAASWLLAPVPVTWRGKYLLPSELLQVLIFCFIVLLSHSCAACLCNPPAPATWRGASISAELGNVALPFYSLLLLLTACVSSVVSSAPGTRNLAWSKYLLPSESLRRLMFDKLLLLFYSCAALLMLSCATFRHTQPGVEQVPAAE